MKGSEDVESIDQRRGAQQREAARAVGSPLSTGGSGRGRFSAADEDGKQAAPPLGRPPANGSAEASGDQTSSAQRAMNLLKMAMPLVQRILPLLDGNFGTAITNLVAPQLQKHAAAPPPTVNVDLEPIERGLEKIETQHRELMAQSREQREQLAEQNTSLRRVEDQLEMVREATDRNTLEQQELLEDLKSVGNKVSMVAVVALGMLVISLLLNFLLYLHIERVLP
jgi:hypothetical protein